ncbi:MAG: tetratricopeptide repeat protein [Flavobacteriales bacterium]|nr:tetratricopeptide repeat protein [Flavobacteriales bacterium]MCB9448779.1 tetratricopeptide repeat protein [Flavobacteriales bacterium]
MRQFLIYICVLLMTGGVWAQDASQSQLELGNQKYVEGRYDDAIKHYEQVLSGGYTSASLEYNLGNAYYKAGQYPRAILHYERALKIDPKLEDAGYNLELANEHTVDRIEPLPQVFFQGWIKDTTYIFSADGWARLTALCMWLACLVLAFYIWLRGRRKTAPLFYGLVLMVCVGVLSFIMASRQNNEQINGRGAIIMQTSVTAKSEPTESGKMLFELHEGTKCNIISRNNDWLNIRLANGNEGWLPADALEII